MGTVKSIPAPVGGWNVKDALADMPEDNAVLLDNWFPGEGRCSVRPGYTEYATGLGGDVETLAELNTGAARKFLGAANGNWWNITAAGAAVSLGSGYGSNQWDTANMDGKIGMVNGVDAPLQWDGTTFGAMTISGSGLTVANLIGVNIFSGRSYFWEDDSQDFWYSAVNTLGGALTKFQLSRVGEFGGKLLAMGNWTLDSGAGADDFAAFFMTSGEIIVYQGTDPSTFSLVGVYYQAPLIARRGIIKFGGDLIAITRDGYVSLAGVLRQGRVGERGILSEQINPAVTEAASIYGGNFGWQSFFYPEGNMLIFNIPITTNTTYQQHVFNTNTGAPCRFKNIPSRCWGIYNNKAYFGGSGSVYLFDDGYADNGANIDCDAQPAWHYFGSHSRQKQATGLQVVMASDGDIAIASALAADFKTPTVSYQEASFDGGESVWDVATWDEASWSSGGNITKDWVNRHSFGYALGSRVRLRTKNQLVKWYSTNYMLVPGGYV